MEYPPISVFADREQSRLLYSVEADRVLDFSARYRFADAVGRPVLHPSYLVTRREGGDALRLKKRAALMESVYGIDRLAAFDEREEVRALLALVVLVLLERSRG